MEGLSFVRSHPRRKLQTAGSPARHAIVACRPSFNPPVGRIERRSRDSLLVLVPHRADAYVSLSGIYWLRYFVFLFM